MSAAVVTIRTDGPGIQIEGQLAADAHVRIQAPEGQGHCRPVLVLELENVGPCQMRVRVEKPYDEASRFVVDALALRLKRGTPVRIAAPLQHARLALPDADSVTPLPHPTPTAP